MRSEPSRLDEVLFDFADILPRRGEDFPYEQVQVGEPGKAG